MKNYYKKSIYYFSSLLFLIALATVHLYSQNLFETEDCIHDNHNEISVTDENTDATDIWIYKCEHDYRGLFVCFRASNYGYDRKTLQIKFEEDWGTDENSHWNDVGRFIEDLICFKRAWKVQPQKAKIRIFNGPYLGVVDLETACN